jgi:hypothetical protein
MLKTLLFLDNTKIRSNFVCGHPQFSNNGGIEYGSIIERKC